MLRRLLLLLAAAAGLAAPRQSRAQTFTDVTVASGLGSPVDVQGVAWADADGDGDLDAHLTLVLSVLLGRGNQLYRNDGPGPGGAWTFTDVAADAGLATAHTSFGSAFA